MDQSASYKKIFIDLGSPMFNFMHRDKGIIVTLAPRSQRALIMENLPTTQGIVILPGSFSLGESLFLITALHSSLSGMVSCVSHFLLLDRMSLRHFTYFGIWVTTSRKGIVMSNYLNTLRTFWNCLSSL